MKRLQLDRENSEEEIDTVDLSPIIDEPPFIELGHPSTTNASSSSPFRVATIAHQLSIPPPSTSSEEDFLLDSLWDEGETNHQKEVLLAVDEVDEETVDNRVNSRHEISTELPPRYWLDDTQEEVFGSVSKYLQIISQPPREVRTRKPKEKRAFSVKVQILQLATAAPSASFISCRLVFADDFTPVPEEDGCFQRVPLVLESSITFQNLGINYPSLKWKDREFCLEISLDNCPASTVRTRKIYSYSNTGVVQRRRSVEIAELGQKSMIYHYRTGLGSYGSLQEDQSFTNRIRMHLVGKTFFKSDRLKVVFRFNFENTWVTLDASEGMEFYSETVLFFTTPKLSSQILSKFKYVGTVKAFVQVTNDGVNFSNGKEFVFRLKPMANLADSAISSSNLPFLSYQLHYGHDDELQSRL
jgi:hypothetical protein